MRGLKGVKEAEIDLDGKKIRIAVVHGTANVRNLVEKILRREVKYHSLK